MRKKKAILLTILLIVGSIIYLGYIFVAQLLGNVEHMPRIFLKTEVSYGTPVWSKDGDRIYYIKSVNRKAFGLLTFEPTGFYTVISESYVMSMRPDGRDKHILVQYKRHSRDELPFVDLRDLILLPDGKELMFYLDITGDCPANVEKENGTYFLETDGKNLRRLTTSYVYPSPDRTKLAYNKADREYGKKCECWIMDIDGQNNHKIIGDNSVIDGWTTDGKILIYARFDEQGNLRPSSDDAAHLVLLVYNPVSGDIKMFDNLPENSIERVRQQNIFVSPDGKRELYMTDTEVIVRNRDGSNANVLLRNRGN